MSNALVPSKLSSYLQNGNNEVLLLQNFTPCLHTDDLIQFHSNGLYMESTIMPTQPQSLALVHQEGSLYGASKNKNISQKSLLPSKRPSDPPYDAARANARKRPFEEIDGKIEETKMTNLEPKCHVTSSDTVHKIPRNNLHPSMRRNQKLGDKITALQKLVSPFAKTDTASVLQEAFLYIKLLQEQIRLLFTKCDEMCCGEKEAELRSKGLCLVPISSLTQNLITMEDQIQLDAVISRTFDYKLPISF